jgi:CYTH domain-containing protein
MTTQNVLKRLNSERNDISEFKLVNTAQGKVEEWKYYKKYHASHCRKEFVVCTICYDKESDEAKTKRRKLNHLKYEVKWLGSTSKLTRHLQTNHRDVFAEMEQKKLASSKNIQSYLKNMDESKEKF